MTILAVAGVSARAMAESARRGGFDVIALDCFGDADTRAASSRWIDIAGTHPFEIDADRLVGALGNLVDEMPLRAWIPGAGFEAQPGALARGARILAMAGTAAEDVRALRDPKSFFAALDEAGIAHPPVRHEPIGDPIGWLVKDAGGRGGWHVRPAASIAPGALPPGSYLQREARGVPMSATFIANGTQARLLGINRQHVRRFGTTRQHVFCGVTGPVAIAPAAMQRMQAALQFASTRFRLRGLGSLDVLVDGDELRVLEVNPRPPASMSLYEPREGGSLIAAHLAACLSGELPPQRPPVEGVVRGLEIVYARRPLAIDARAAALLARRADCHDRPLAGSRFSVGDPVCSLSACAATADAVEAALAAARDELLNSLETAA